MISCKFTLVSWQALEKTQWHPQSWCQDSCNHPAPVHWCPTEQEFPSQLQKTSVRNLFSQWKWWASPTKQVGWSQLALSVDIASAEGKILKWLQCALSIENFVSFSISHSLHRSLALKISLCEHCIFLLIFSPQLRPVHIFGT